MDLRFTAEQLALQELCRKVADRIATEPDVEVGRNVLTETGLTGLLVEEDRGGSGASLVEGVLLAEQFGRALVPGSFLSSALVAPLAVDLVEMKTQSSLVEWILQGMPATVAVGADLTWPRSSNALAWGWAQGAVVLGSTDAGFGLVQVTGPGRATADPSLLVAPVEAAGDTPAGEAAAWFTARVNVALAGVLVGHMTAALDASVDYVRQRRQFGVPVGSFQAVKHLCADMYVDLESARSAAYGAAATLSETPHLDRATVAAATAKAWCGEAAIRVIETAIQVHGGIGFTWECALHRYLRAAHVVASSFTTVDAALDTIAEVAPCI